MNVENLYDYTNNNLDTDEGVFYFISQKVKIGNSLMTLAVSKNDNKIYTYSCEWLYLIKAYYPDAFFYKSIVTSYNQLLNKTYDETHKDKKIIPFITSFSKGTTHGYSGLYCILNNYINNKEKYKDYYIAVYKNSQKGLLDIIHCLTDKKVIDKSKIIYLNKEIKYLFKSITFIPNKWHEIYSILNSSCDYHSIYDNLIVKYFVDINYSTSHENVCLIKSFEDKNKEKNVERFSKLNNLYNINVNAISEIQMINLIYHSKVFVCSWGTSFLKNFFYVSEKCEKIIVLVVEGISHIPQFIGMKNRLLKNYKNANIYYYIVTKFRGIYSFDINKSNFYDYNFDWKSYVNRYSDLQKAGINTEKKALRHYVYNGINEGRKSN